MAELLKQLQELRNLSPEVHWFCHLRDGTNDVQDVRNLPNKDAASIEGGVSEEVTLIRRRRLVTDCLQLYGYDGEDVRPHQKYLEHQIDRQLGKCDTCVVEYYKAKYQAMEVLRSEYEEEEVAALAKIFDDRDIIRIKRGLENAVQILRATPHENRGKDILSLSTQLSVFEAFSCQAFLADTCLVQQYLDEPFRLIQTNKKLRLAHFVPAATVFLFDAQRDRCLWAMQVWSKYSYPISKENFDFAVRDSLLKNLKTASEPITDLNFVQRLWYGIRQIVEKLDNNLITHSLRAMEVDLFRVALEHLQFNTAGLRFLMQTIQKLLEVAPKDFWESMGAISPTTVTEQVFNNPQYDKFVHEARKDQDYETSALKDMLAWIKPFIESLQTGHQAQACRTFTFQLLDRLQMQDFPAYARFKCYVTGLDVLSWALGNCNREDTMLKPVGRIVAAETLQVASKYIKQILDMPKISIESEETFRLLERCLATVKVSLTLECKSLRTDQETLRQKRDIQPGFGSYSAVIWDEVVRHLDRGNIMVARAALTGINDLIGLEKFKINTDESYAEEKSKYNATLGQLTHLSCQMLERINDFNPSDLDELFRHEDTATALVAALFSPDASTYEAGINLIKSISSESARKEAIGHLLLPFFATTLNSFSWSIHRIAKNKRYASCPRMLKTCADVVDILCDSQNGLLRTRALTGPAEIKAVEDFWENQWQALKVIYEMTEEWGRTKVDNSSAMKEFCRDTMQFSEHFFDQYSVFASAINSATSIAKPLDAADNDTDLAGKALLKHPAEILEAMVKWLKLRDVYLAGTAVQLTKKVLDRLSEWSMKVTEAPCKSLEHIINSLPQGRTHLTPQEKAELGRALEANLGRSIMIEHTDHEQSESLQSNSAIENFQGPSSSGVKQKTKTSTIDIGAWRSKALTKRTVVNISDDDDLGESDIIDQDILSINHSVRLSKQNQGSRSSSNTSAQVPSTLRSVILGSAQKCIKNDSRLDLNSASFRQKRQQENEAKKKRDSTNALLLKKTVGKTAIEQGSREGSVLNGMGIKGKEHVPKDSSMMVSSGSESDSFDELDKDFGTSSKLPKVSDAVLDYQNSKLKPIKEHGPIKKVRQIRSAKDMRARLAPDLTSLHKTILGWDFFHTGDFPPGSARQDYSLVGNTFDSPVDYHNTFEPLLVLEAWQGFLKSREEGNFKAFEIKIANRLTVDSFIEVSTTMSIAEGKDIGISESDVVLMSKATSPTVDASQPHCFARIFKVFRKKNSMEITYRVNVANSLIASMVPNGTVFGNKIQSLTPLEREYGALSGLKYFDLCDEIIKAKPSPLLNYTEKQLGHLVSNYSINNAQAKAVKSAIDNDAFTLIQGPPGSGKTKTIVAIVGALLTGSFSDKGISIARPQSNERRQENPSALKKLLICAPSNAAVDELVMRFKEGVKTLDGQSQNVSVVRLGRSDAINANVLDVTLEELVNAKLNLADSKKTGSGEDVHQIMMAHKATCVELNILRTSIDQNKASGKAVTAEQDREFDLLKRKKQQLSQKIDIARDSGDVIARDIEINRRKVQQEILDNAHILCATLSGSGNEMFQNLNIEFETVIIDEAAQSIELSALIPLKYGCSKCILVGDPKQLPPTVLSREAARFQYEQSLFVRMQANHPDDVHLLDTQYRMHPEISVFPSNAFYDGKLLDGEDMATMRTKPWHQSSILGPYRFFDVQGTHQSAVRGHSLINIAEIEVSLHLFHRLITDCKGYDFKGKVGIITPYKSQLKELRSRFVQKYGESIFATIEFNTTDAFQGRESEVIIFSCVRASTSRGIGFLSDIRRMNVGITRAKSSLWVLGNSQSLMNGEFWSRLIQDAKSRDRYTGGDVIGILKRQLLNLNLGKVVPQEDSRSTGNTLKANQDAEMQDASMNNEPIRHSENTKANNSPLDQDMNDAHFDALPINGALPKGGKENDSSTSRPSGGFNGLNHNANCQKCGSSAHQTRKCDNKDVKALYGDKCYRCGDTTHFAAHCTVERCLQCGLIGHSQKTCTSTHRISRLAKERIEKSEDDHQRRAKQSLEAQRKKQLGDHAKEVPKVYATSATPPSEQPSFKRKRETSPTSTENKALNGLASKSSDVDSSNQSSSTNNHKRPVIDNPPKRRAHSGIPKGPAANNTPKASAADNLPKGPASDRKRDQQLSHRYSNRDHHGSSVKLAASSEASGPDRLPPSSPHPQETFTEASLPPELKKNDEALPSGGDEKGYPPQRQNLLSRPPPNPIRPMIKKRKEASPFIIPKDKRPRR